MEKEIADDPPQIDGPLVEESELLEQQLVQIVERAASRASGDGIDGPLVEESELLELTRILREGMKRPVAPEFSTLLTSTLLNLQDEIARNAPQTKQGQAYGLYLARATHALISRSPLKAELRRKGPRENPRQRQASENPDLLEGNPAYWKEIKRLFGEKDLRLRGSTSTKLVNEAMKHFSDVYD